MFQHPTAIDDLGEHSVCRRFVDLFQFVYFDVVWAAGMVEWYFVRAVGMLRAR